MNHFGDGKVENDDFVFGLEVENGIFLLRKAERLGYAIIRGDGNVSFSRFAALV